MALDVAKTIVERKDFNFWIKVSDSSFTITAEHPGFKMIIRKDSSIAYNP